MSGEDIHSCFGTFDGNNVDLSGLSPVEALGKVSAMAMLVTQRVGDPNEDASMSQAKQHLSEINKRGFVTTDSQMGKIESVRALDGSDVTQRQRSYVVGYLPNHLALEFKRRMDFVDGVMPFVGHSGRPIPWNHAYKIPVTIVGDEFATDVPMMPQALRGFDFLPEVHSIMRDGNCKRIVEEDALFVNVVDTIWGRPFWLFEKISEILDEVNQN